MNDLAESLFSGGVLFIGIAETSSVKHPLLESCCLSDVFYFKKTGRAFYYDLPDLKQNTVATVKKEYSANAKKPIRTETAKPPEILKTNLKASLPVNCEKVAAILGRDEGEPNAKKTLEFLESGNDVSACEASPLESELVASAVYFLGVQDFNSADMVLVFLEKLNAGAFTRFLRGEYHFLRGSAEAAEPYFKEAAGKEKAFWPAFYRIASLAAHGNPASYGYKIKKACESLDLGREFHYECFLGGFSPDYYRQILIRRAPEIQLNPNENKVN
jgi:chemotaxis protein methyltransferase CheR